MNVGAGLEVEVEHDTDTESGTGVAALLYERDRGESSVAVLAVVASASEWWRGCGRWEEEEGDVSAALLDALDSLRTSSGHLLDDDVLTLATELIESPSWLMYAPSSSVSLSLLLLLALLLLLLFDFLVLARCSTVFNNNCKCAGAVCNTASINFQFFFKNTFLNKKLSKY